MGALLEETKFDGLKLFKLGVEKLMKYKRYLRKKQFKFNDLIAFLKKHNQEQINHSEQESKALIKSVYPIVKARMSKLVTLRVEKMAVAVEKQSFKIEKMVQILTRVH